VADIAISEVEAVLRAALVQYTIIGEMVDTASLGDGKLLSVI
jgi:hypothetical protein